MRLIGLSIAALSLSSIAFAGSHAKPVGLTSTLMEQQVMHQGQPVIIQRNQDNANTNVSDYALTSRPCPPFCIQPMDLAPGVETIGEFELLSLLEKINFAEIDGLLIDSRTPDWAKKVDPWRYQSPLHHIVFQKVRHVYHFGYFRKRVRCDTT